MRIQRIIVVKISLRRHAISLTYVAYKYIMLFEKIYRIIYYIFIYQTNNI